jgi:2',3'-cyclic-nucleotide 2'-phosphodiesterase (5'-nucleotidase family)
MGPRLLHYSDVENAFDDPERIGRLAGLLGSLDGEDALVAGTGDDTSPGVLALATEGRQSLPFFEAVDTDVETFGNHDFDYGPAATRGIVADSPQTWVSANVMENGDRFGADEGVVPWTVLEADGERVGFFGVTDPTTASINPAAEGLEFTDPMAAAERAVDALRTEAVDHVVALSHLGKDDDDLARRVDVDVVLGGHVHDERVAHVDGTVLTRPGVNGRVLMEVSLPDGEVVRHEVADGPLDDGVADAIRETERETGMAEVVATVAEPVARDREAAFGGESRLGNWVTDAYRWATGADVGLQNAGGIREGDPLAGEVTAADVVGLVPFEEPIDVAELSGAELVDVVTEGAGEHVAFERDGAWHAHLSGASAVIDADAGEVVELRVGGEPVDPGATYTLATSSYLLYTDHEFPSLTESHRVDQGGIQYEVLLEYARDRGIDPTVDGRIELR